MIYKDKLLPNFMNQQTIWNKIAEPWQKFRKRTPSEVESFIADKKGKVLDLGCGSGRNIIPNENIEYYGVDFSEEMLKIAEKDTNEKKAKAIFFQADIGKEKLPFSGNFFDAAIFISTLHCIETKEQRKYALTELFRVMKKDAVAMISVWKRGVNGLYGKEGMLNWKKDGINHARYYYFYDEKELKDLLKAVGFKILEAKQSNTPHSNKNIVVYAQKK